MSLNNVLLKIVVLLLFFTSNQASAPTYTRYKIGLELPFPKEEHTPWMSCLYQGQYFKSNGCIEIILPTKQKEFYIVIANLKALTIPINCDIYGLQINKNYPFRMWHIVSVYHHDNTTDISYLIWSASEANYSNSIKIFDNSLIVVWDDPSDIVTIKQSKSSTTGPLICLPTLVFNNISLKDFKRKENYMHSATLDLKFGHESFCSTIKVNELANQAISIPTNTRRII